MVLFPPSVISLPLTFYLIFIPSLSLSLYLQVFLSFSPSTIRRVPPSIITLLRLTSLQFSILYFSLSFTLPPPVISLPLTFHLLTFLYAISLFPYRYQKQSTSFNYYFPNTNFVAILYPLSLTFFLTTRGRVPPSTNLPLTSLLFFISSL